MTDISKLIADVRELEALAIDYNYSVEAEWGLTGSYEAERARIKEIADAVVAALEVPRLPTMPKGRYGIQEQNTVRSGVTGSHTITSPPSSPD